MDESMVFNSLVTDQDNDLCFISESGHKYILIKGVDFDPNCNTYDLIFIIDSLLFTSTDFEGDGFVGLLFGADYVKDPHWISAIKAKVDSYERRLKNA